MDTRCSFLFCLSAFNQGCLTTVGWNRIIMKALYPGLGKRLSMIKHPQYVINLCINNVCLRHVYVQTFCRIACVDCVYMLCHNLHCSYLIWSYSVHFHLTSCPWNSLSTRLMNIDYYCKWSRKLRQWEMRLRWFLKGFILLYTLSKNSPMHYGGETTS